MTRSRSGTSLAALRAASPLALRWLDQTTVQSLLLALIAAVYIGFAVADGRPRVIAVECVSGAGAAEGRDAGVHPAAATAERDMGNGLVQADAVECRARPAQVAGLRPQPAG